MRKTAIVTMILASAMVAALGGCASKMESGYGVGIQAEREAAVRQSQQKQDAPDTPGMYLALIDKMQSQGLFYASLAHIDAYEKQYGATPDTVLLRADALRQTSQSQASADAYTKLLNTPLAARGYRGLGLLAGSAGDFGRASESLATASRLEPTDALTLSDLAYARLRLGDISGARVPLMKAAELAQSNPKILSNVALYLFVDGQPAAAQGLIAQQKFSPEVQQAIRADAQRISAASTQASHARVAAVAAATSERARVPASNVPQTVDSLLHAQLPLTQTLGSHAFDQSGATAAIEPQLVAR
ncbi:tetratricopeptide repeat protein [Burkholderia sp. Leaf177]|uniref:tetratricopeptide repeat protein n=1 Tax=Burkholderia sp. Leaf177 TaxID=1736287 RepID=UPI000A637922|nr:pilus assembly protein [Burkholderia sp. Leaf177]